MKRMNTELKLSFLQPINKNSIPVKRRNRQSVIETLPVWSELRQVVEYTKQHGAIPFEQAAEIDLTQFKTELSRFKHPVLSMLTKVRELLKTYKVSTKLEVIRRGEKIYLVGN